MRTGQLGLAPWKAGRAALRERVSPSPTPSPGVGNCQAPASTLSPGSRLLSGPRRGPRGARGPSRAFLAREDLHQQVGGQHVRRLLEADGQQLLVVPRRLRAQNPGRQGQTGQDVSVPSYSGAPPLEREAVAERGFVSAGGGKNPGGKWFPC